MKYSIIIPTAFDKRKELLQPCIESIQKYTDLTDVEIIVVANGCTDDAVDWLTGFDRNTHIIISRIDDAVGYPHAINTGIKIARGEFLILLNNDTILLEQPKNQWIDVLTRAFWDEKMAIAGPMKEWCPWAEHHFILFFCAMIRKSVLDSVGLLDEAFSPGIGEDTDLCCRVQLAGYKIAQVPDDDDYRFYDHNKRIGNFPIWHSGTKTFQHLGDENDSVVAGVSSDS